MLKKLVLRNFQKHRKLVIEFDPHVTTIVGPSDAGKSTIIRALRWVSLNKPQGTKFTTWGEDYVKVTLEAEEVISRSRSSTKNLYKLAGHSFRAFGDSVPTAITDSLKIVPANFQKQHDLPYWFSLSAGQVGKELNQIVNLEVIDKTLATIAARKRKTEGEVEYTKERLKAAKQESQKLEWIQAAQERLREVEQFEERTIGLGVLKDSLAHLLEQIDQAVEEKTAAKHRLKRAEVLANTLGSSVKRWGEIASLKNGLGQLLEEIEEVEDQLWQLQQEISKREQILAAVPRCPACGQIIQ